MEIPQIDEIRFDTQVGQADERVNVKAAEAEKRKCVYNKDTVCQVPDCKMEICATCPYGKSYSFSQTVKDVFNKIISMTIFLAKSDDVLRDVMVLIAKGNVENNGKEGKEVKDVKEVGKGEAGRGVEGVVEARPIIKQVDVKDIKVAAASPQRIMTRVLAQKVADISEALANPNGPEKPLV